MLEEVLYENNYFISELKILLPRKIKIELHEPNEKSAVLTPVGKFLSQIESNRHDVIYII
jgi:hypothetical protein